MDPVLTGAAANNSSESAKGIFQEVKRHFRCVTTNKKNVGKLGSEKRAKDLEEEKAKNNYKCFIGLCPSIKPRYQHSRRAEEGATATATTIACEGLIQQSQFTEPKDLEAFESSQNAKNTFSIGCNLDDKDAWDLFKKIVGGNISPELQAIGEEIAKKCGGLPLVISAVARTLRNKDQLAWTTALSQLQTTPSSTDADLTELSDQFQTIPSSTDVSPAVYAALKLCYNHIEGDEVKRFFLLCSILSPDFLTEALLRYAIGLGLFPGGDYTMEEARDRMSRWVRNLKAFGLLLDSYSNDRIDMHDIICDVAISIAFEENNHVLALKQKALPNDWPDVETRKRCSWINLLRLAIYTELPDVVQCPRLSFLRVVGENCSTEVPPDFFKEMKMLQVLDLADMNLSSFPSSIGLLSNLQTLCLHQSELGDITVVGELKALEILSLSSSDIEKLPEEIGQLVKLKVLDLRGCTKLKIIPPGLISKIDQIRRIVYGG